MAETTANSILRTIHGTDGYVRRVLLLQGPSSFFFRDLGLALKRKGALVTRLAFTAGDRMYWSKAAGEVVWYRKTSESYANWVQSLCEIKAITDVVMLGDGRLYHRILAELIRDGRVGANLHVIEHGLIRPGLILRDPHGMGGNSQIPNAFRKASISPRPLKKRSRGGSFLEYAALDVSYHAISVPAGLFLNRHYVRHSVDHPLKEYGGWIRKALTRPSRVLKRKAAERRIAAIGKKDLFLFPLQLSTDFQVRDHGVGEPQETTLARVIESFAEHSDDTAMLVVKRHPLDNGWTPWHRIISEQTRRLAVEARVEYVDGGSLEALLKRARGVVTINSTVGLTAVLSGIPCRVLGTAVYDLPGLTAPEELESFWRKPTSPDSETAKTFERFLIQEYHVSGAFDGPGSKEGAENLAQLICEEVEV